MYLVFSLAALPFACLSVNDALYYQAHSEMLQSRDSAPLVFAALMAIALMKPALGLAVLLALYFLVSGPRAARFSGAVLTSAWLLTLASEYLATPPQFASTARLYWDAVPFVALSVLPWICAGIRLAHRSARRPTHESDA